MTAKEPRVDVGPYRVENIRPGERYELHDGHRVYCAPAGGSHSAPNALGAAVVGADPNVTEHVVRLTGPRRVEVYEPGKAMRTVGPGAHLMAPGVLKNPVLVEALYDRDAANRATLTNLLQREGYEDLDAVRAEGKAEGMRAAVRSLCRVLAIPVSAEREALLDGMSAAELDGLREHIERDRRWD